MTTPYLLAHYLVHLCEWCKLPNNVLGKTRKRAYQSAVVILNVAIDLIAVHFMYHVVFSFLVIRAVYLRRNVSRAVFAI